MKKTIFVSLCVLLMTGTFAFGYGISGRVLDASGNGVSGATVTINCYPSSGGSKNDSDTSGTFGGYSGGWPLCNCNGEKMVVKAVKDNKSGTVTWTASGVADVKNVTISQPMLATAELHCEAEPVAIHDVGDMEISNVNLYVQFFAGPVLVNGGHTTMHYDTQTMSCTGVHQKPPFNNFSYTFPAPGTIEVWAYAPPGTYELVENGTSPTPFFDLEFESLGFEPPGTKSYVTLESSEIETDMVGTISAFPSQTECVIGEPPECKPYFLIESQSEWEEALASEWPKPSVAPMLESEWNNYMAQWNDATSETEGEPYPDNEFRPAELWVYEGGGEHGGYNYPNEPGLVMAWGRTDSQEPTEPNCASAWRWDYGMDPDLRNSTITVTVWAPQWASGGSSVQVTSVSFGIVDTAGLRRSWWWNVGNPPAQIPWNTPVTVTIDTSKTGITATTPTASGYMNAAGFNLAQSQVFDVDENFTWGGPWGTQTIPPPGQTIFAFMGWNYWHNLLVTRNIGGGGTNSKWYIKYSQPPVVIDGNDPPIITGWDEVSDYNNPPIWADDWPCKDDRPITDIHWWGSFLGWTQPEPPPISMLPKAFHIGIWTDVPDDPLDPDDYSHPGTLIWENYCDNWVWNYAGYDLDPFERPERENEACFQFTQLLSEDEWFRQKPSDEPDIPQIYWLSIAAVYDEGQEIPYPWGWKSRPHKFQDDACSILQLADGSWPPTIGAIWNDGIPLKGPESETWDLAFELTTNEPGATIADLNLDGIVNFLDFAAFAEHWLATP